MSQQSPGCPVALIWGIDLARYFMENHRGDLMCRSIFYVFGNWKYQIGVVGVQLLHLDVEYRMAPLFPKDMARRLNVSCDLAMIRVVGIICFRNQVGVSRIVGPSLNF